MSEPITIAEILSALKLADPKASVWFDFAGCRPTTVGSWRGVYAEPALGWVPSGYSRLGPKDGEDATVTSLIAELENVIAGRPHDAWKSGTYRYNQRHKLHVDNPGDCNYTMIVGVADRNWHVVLLTANVES